MTRRQFLEASAGVVTSAAAWQGVEAFLGDSSFASRTLVPLEQVGNPLESYPNRDWEQVRSL